MIPSAIILVVDRLGAGFLGPYGNTWVETQHCNRLASQSLLCEFAMSDSPSLETVYRSYWTGLHAMSSEAVDVSLPQLAAKAGLRTILLTDEPLVANHPLADGFTARILLPQTETATPAAEVEETAIARLTQGAMELLSKQTAPYLLWIHSRGMSGAWDAPLEYRNLFRDEEDPQPGEFTAPPLIRAQKSFDPDELLRYVHAYAGQVTVFDLCLGALLDALNEHPAAADTLLALTSPRGYPLGEHGQVGPVEDNLYGEVLSVPLLLRMPQREGALLRTQQLVQPHDLFELLRALIVPRDSAALGSVLLSIAQNREHPSREVACAIGKGERAIRTPAWFLREVESNSQREGAALHELFAKPDDRWEVNEVASRAPEAAESLIALLNAFEQVAREGELADLPPLAESLCDQWR